MNQNMPMRCARVIALAGALAVGLLAPPMAPATVVEDDKVVVSFDDTKIVYTLFLPDSASPANPVPAVLLAHGMGAPRNSKVNTPVREHLLAHGYAVLTWDARGLGESGGDVKFDNPDFEGRDVQKLIDVLAADPRVAKEKPGDPRVGMTGSSYGGAIQYVVAALDGRVDAIAPEVAFHSAEMALIPDGVVKSTLPTGYVSWFPSAFGVDPNHMGAHPSNPAGPAEAVTGNFDPIFHRWAIESAAGEWSQRVRDFFAAPGPYHLLDRVRVPVFILQGTHDTIVGPSHGVANYLGLRRAQRSQPLKMMWMCDEQHGPCTPATLTDRPYVLDRIRQWMDRHVREDDTVDTGPVFEYPTQDGRFHGARSYPPRSRAVVSERRAGAVAVPGVPVLAPRGNVGPPGTVPAAVRSGATPSPSAFEVPLPPVEGTLIGQPVVRMTATAPAGTRPVALFFMLVDEQRGHVLGNQVTPKAIVADGKPHTYEFPVEGVAFASTPADRLALHAVGSVEGWEASRFTGDVRLEDVSVEVPVRVADPVGAAPRIRVQPHRSRVGRRTRFRFRVSAGGAPVGGALIRLAGRRVRTDATGRATLVHRFSKPGRYVARLRATGQPPARITVRVLPARR